MKNTNWDSRKCYNRLQALKCKRGRKKGLLWERINILKNSREVHLDATPILIIDLNVSEHITNSKPPHPNAPFFSPLGMPSLDFESMHPLCFTPTWPTPLVSPSHKPHGWQYIALPLYWPSIVRENVDS
jgi:hypothetical protein